jgi:hypothetical protein
MLKRSWVCRGVQVEDVPEGGADPVHTREIDGIPDQSPGSSKSCFIHSEEPVHQYEHAEVPTLRLGLEDAPDADNTSVVDDNRGINQNHPYQFGNQFGVRYTNHEGGNKEQRRSAGPI